MTEADGKYGEDLRSALSAAADLVVPVGNGLDNIRGRVARRRAPALAWWCSYWPYVPQQTFIKLRIAGSWVAAAAGGHAGLKGSLRARQQRPGGSGRKRTTGDWLRPALAAAGAMVIVLAVALAIPRLRDQIGVQLSNNGSNSQSGPGAVQGTGSTDSNSSSALGQPTNSAGVPGLGLEPGKGSSSGCMVVSQSPTPNPTSSTPTVDISPSSAPGPGGASPGIVNGGAADAYGAALLADRPAPLPEQVFMQGPPPCAPRSTPSPHPSTYPSSPVSTPTSPTSTPTSPTSTPTSPTSTPTSPTSTPTSPTSTPTTPGQDGGGSPSPTQSASPG